MVKSRIQFSIVKLLIDHCSFSSPYIGSDCSIVMRPALEVKRYDLKRWGPVSDVGAIKNLSHYDPDCHVLGKIRDTSLDTGGVSTEVKNSWLGRKQCIWTSDQFPNSYKIKTDQRWDQMPRKSKYPLWTDHIHRELYTLIR